MVGDCAAEKNGIPHLHAARAKSDPLRHDADTARVDVAAVSLTSRHDFRIARHDVYAGSRRRVSHRRNDPCQFIHREAFLENECSAEPFRFGSDHRQIVDRAMHGQLADVPSRKEPRLNDERIGAKGDTLLAQCHNTGIA